jgi:hypothetical protein
VVLRAVNVGRHNRVRMDALRDALVSAGFGDIRSYLQTGNLTLDAEETDAEAVAARVESVMSDLDLRAPCAVVRPWPDFVALAAQRPFGGWSGERYSLTVSFCRSPIPDLITEPWVLQGLTFLGGTTWAVFSVLPRDLVRAPSASALIERRWGIPASTRYWHVLTDFVEREAAADRKASAG